MKRYYITPIVETYVFDTLMQRAIELGSTKIKEMVTVPIKVGDRNGFIKMSKKNYEKIKDQIKTVMDTVDEELVLTKDENGEYEVKKKTKR